MTKTTKTLLCLLIIAGLMMGIAACGTPKDDDTTPTNTPTPTEAAGDEKEAPNDELEHLTIVWEGPQYGPANEDAPIIKEIEERFNVTIEDVYIESAQKTELLNLRFASDELLDIWTTTDPNAFREWVRQEVLLEIGREETLELAPSIAQEIDEWEEKLGQNIWGTTIVDGVSYGLPQMNVDSTYVKPTIWRDDWLAAVGIDKIPETIEEFEEALYAFAKEDPDGNGANDTYGLSQSGLETIYGISGYWPEFWHERDGEIVWGGIQPEMKDVLGMLAQWYKDGVIDPEFPTGENQGGYWAISHAFINGKIGLSGLGMWYHWNPPYFEGGNGGSNYNEFVVLQEGGTYDFGVPAVGSDGKSGRNVGFMANGPATCFSYKLADKPEVLERIMLILESVNTDRDLYMFVKYGIEGEHYQLINGEPNTLEGVDPASIGASNMFVPWQSMKLYQSMRPTNYEFANQVVGGHLPSYTNAVTERLPSDGDYKADLDAFQLETYYNIINGTQPVDYFDTFVSEWLARGGETLTREANEWYSANK